MSKNKKIVKWEYVTEPEEEYVLASDIRRTHSPLKPSLSRGCCGALYLTLRSCVQGLGEDGKPVKTLYCTRDGRFFVKRKDRWNELLPSCVYRNGKHPKGDHNGTTDIPQMRQFGNKMVHRCVAFAWCNPPENAAELEVDHLNGSHKNWTADNLQFVTAAENRRRATLLRNLRKAGFDPASCTTAALRIILNAM